MINTFFVGGNVKLWIREEINKAVKVDYSSTAKANQKVSDPQWG